MLVGDDVAERRSFADAEEDVTAAVHEHHGQHVCEPNVVERERKREARVREAPEYVADDQQPLSVPAVDECACRKRQHEQRHRRGELGDPRLRGRAGGREYQERNRDPRDASPEVREDLAAPEQVEIAVPA